MRRNWFCCFHRSVLNQHVRERWLCTTYCRSILRGEEFHAFRRPRNFCTRIDDTTIYGSARGNIFVSETFVCIDSSCDRITAVQDIYAATNQDGAQLRLAQTTRNEFERIDTEAEFVAAINEAYETYNVSLEFQIPAPMVTRCLAGDPDCSESIYQEPNATVRAGPIAGIVGTLLISIVG